LEKEWRMSKPEHLGPVRDALRSFRNRLTRKSQEPAAGEASAAPGASGPKRWRTGLAVFWRVYRGVGLVAVGLFVVYMIYLVFVGLYSYGGGFGFGNLDVLYEVEAGGLLGERLVYAVIIPGFPERGYSKESDNTYTFRFADGNSVAVRPERGEMVWVDQRYHVQRLGRVLRAGDIHRLKEFGDRRRSATISSPQEFLAIVARLRNEPNAQREPKAVANK
jgi:hypothetical protein